MAAPILAAGRSSKGLAGIYDAGGLDAESARRRLQRALGGQSAAPELVFVSVEETAGGSLLDGEIFNLEALDDLGGSGDSPVEELLGRAYARLGPALLDRLRGGFVLLLWSSNQPPILAADQFGLGTVYLAEEGGTTLFASELFLLLRLLARRPGPDASSVVHTIVTGDPPDGATLYEGIAPMPAAHYARLGNPATLQRFWQPTYERPLRLSRDEIIERLWDEVERAVASRLDAGGATGIIMSGGIDSSTVAAAAAGSGSPVRTYSAVFPGHADARVNEFARIDQIAEALRLPNVQFAIEPQGLLWVSLELLAAWEVPLTGPGYLVERPLLERARLDGIHVLLDGQGGDECFSASAFLPADLLRRGRVLASWRQIASFPGAAYATPRQLRSHWLHFAVHGALPYGVERLRSRRRTGRAISYLTEEGARLYTPSDASWAWKKRPGVPRWWAWKSFLTATARPLAAGYLRQRARYHGMHARPPLFDVDLVDFLLQIPPELEFNPVLPRVLIREALAQRVPDDVRLSRVKSNLAPFYYACATGADFEPIKRLLTDRDAETARYVHRDFVTELLGRRPQADSASKAAWVASVSSLTAAECWLRQQADSSFADRLRAGLQEPASHLHRERG